MAKLLYHGFSTNNWITDKTFGTANFETVKQDLMGHLMTIKGTRVMMPDWGTRIPLMTFEPNDEVSRKIVEDDIRTVIEYDPRVSLIDLKVVSYPDSNTMIAFVDILYIEFNVTDVLHIEVKTGE